MDRVLSPLSRVGVSSTRRRSALSRVLSAPAHRQFSLMRSIQPAAAGAVAAARALISGSVSARVGSGVDARVCSVRRTIAGQSLGCGRAARSASAFSATIGGLTLRSTGRAGTCLDRRHPSARRAGYLER